MGNRIHPTAGEPFCPSCHASDDADCTQEHEAWFAKFTLRDERDYGRLLAERDSLRDLVRELLARWREADYHWALEFGEVPRTWQEWWPKEAADVELIARARAALGEGEP